MTPKLAERDPVKKVLLAAVSFLLALSLTLASAQQSSPADPPDAQGEDKKAQQPDQSMAGMNMPGMNMPTENQNGFQLPSPHEGSGTAWQPASVQGPDWMWMCGGWELMAHGVIFVDYNQQGGPRGEGKAESVNWGMLMEQHRLGGGTILFRQMFSAESLTSPHPGFPELFQTGETYHGEPLVDHQHPHNVFAELAALYMLPLSKKISWELYGGPSAEPALGPVTYIHRTSAAEFRWRRSAITCRIPRIPASAWSPRDLSSTGSSWKARPSTDTNRMKNAGVSSQLRWIPGRCAAVLLPTETGPRNTVLGISTTPRRWNPRTNGGRRHLWSTTGRWRRGIGRRRRCGDACTRSVAIGLIATCWNPR